jgi:murein L,D-transpeptidase YafK
MNDLIDEVYTLVSVSAMRGQSAIPFHIFPFPVEDDMINYALRVFPQWRQWWTSLKSGYDAFESTNIPPKVRNGNWMDFPSFVILFVKTGHYHVHQAAFLCGGASWQPHDRSAGNFCSGQSVK